MPQEKQIYSPADIAHRWDVDPKTVRDLLNSGKLMGFRAGTKAWRVRREILEEYELCLQNNHGDLHALQESGASLGTSETEPEDDTGLEPDPVSKPKRKPRLPMPPSPDLRAVQ